MQARLNKLSGSWWITGKGCIECNIELLVFTCEYLWIHGPCDGCGNIIGTNFWILDISRRWLFGNIMRRACSNDHDKGKSNKLEAELNSTSALYLQRCRIKPFFVGSNSSSRESAKQTRKFSSKHAHQESATTSTLIRECQTRSWQRYLDIFILHLHFIVFIVKKKKKKIEISLGF